MWRSVSLLSDGAHAELMSEAFLEHGAVSVSIEDADAGTERERQQFGEPGARPAGLWDASRVIALFDSGVQLASVVEECAKVCGLPATPPYHVADVPEQDWVRLTQSQFEPVRVNERLWVVPTWHHPPDPHAINITLDPGMAFGTGTHPTTRLCLDWLCTNIAGSECVLDYGCGSGILGICAALLGARCVVGVDIDEQALRAAAENARRNHVDLTLFHSRNPLHMQFDRVVANILANPLCVLAPLLCGLLKPGGRLALSGVLTGQSEQVAATYEPFLSLSVCRQVEGWVLLEGTHP